MEKYSPYLVHQKKKYHANSIDIEGYIHYTIHNERAKSLHANRMIKGEDTYYNVWLTDQYRKGYANRLDRLRISTRRIDNLKPILRDIYDGKMTIEDVTNLHRDMLDDTILQFYVRYHSEFDKEFKKAPEDFHLYFYRKQHFKNRAYEAWKTRWEREGKKAPINTWTPETASKDNTKNYESYIKYTDAPTAPTAPKSPQSNKSTYGIPKIDYQAKISVQLDPNSKNPYVRMANDINECLDVNTPREVLTSRAHKFVHYYRNFYYAMNPKAQNKQKECEDFIVKEMNKAGDYIKGKDDTAIEKVAPHFDYLSRLTIDEARAFGYYKLGNRSTGMSDIND